MIEQVSEKNASSAIVLLRPEEGKALIGEAVSHLPQVRAAYKSGRMAVVGGSTNRYVAWSLTGEDPGLDVFAVGWINNSELGESPPDGRGPGAFMFNKGKVTRGWPKPLLQEFEAGDIYIKGGNAIDSEGNVGILMGSPVGGTIGAALAIILARGAELIIPISLQKLIPSVSAVGGLLGHGRIGRIMGSCSVGYMPILANYATVVTEVTAMSLLYGVEATAIASGGLGDCIGSISLHLAGEPEAVNNAWLAVQKLRSRNLESRI